MTSVSTGILFRLAPALHFSKANTSEVLKERGRILEAARESARTRQRVMLGTARR